MQLEPITDRGRIESFLRKDAAAHVYALADLDDFFWPETRWFAALAGGEVVALCFVLRKLDPPVLYAVSPPEDEATRSLLHSLRQDLPPRLFVNLGLGLAPVFSDTYRLDSEGVWLKMCLGRPIRVEVPANVEKLSPRHLDELRDFYAHSASAPDESTSRFFEPYMLGSGAYFGVREAGRLVAAGGTHVLSACRRSARISRSSPIVCRPRRRSSWRPVHPARNGWNYGS